jgi:hypothetical protein
MNKDLINKISLVLGGVLIGSGTTYLIVNQRLQTKYIRIANESIDRQLAQYTQNEELVDELGYRSDDEILEVAPEEPAIYNALTGEQEIVAEAEEIVAVNTDPQITVGGKLVKDILEKATDVINHDVRPPEQAKKVITLDDVLASPADIPAGNIFDVVKEPSPKELRDKAYPYVISEDEFHQDEEHYDKITLTYYEGDGVLADERDQLVPDIKGTIGKDSVTHFGYDKNNPDVIYVRNDARKADFEVIRDEQTYAEAVFGARSED